jgi:hypothetical protein
MDSRYISNIVEMTLTHLRLLGPLWKPTDIEELRKKDILLVYSNTTDITWEKIAGKCREHFCSLPILQKFYDDDGEELGEVIGIIARDIIIKFLTTLLFFMDLEDMDRYDLCPAEPTKFSEIYKRYPDKAKEYVKTISLELFAHDFQEMKNNFIRALCHQDFRKLFVEHAPEKFDVREIIFNHCGAFLEDIYREQLSLFIKTSK